MIDKDNSVPILTINFSKLAVAFKQSIARREITGVISPDGIGFKYTIRKFAEKHYLRVIYCNVRHSESIRQVLLSLYKDLCNVKFSNLDYRHTTLFDLTRVINARLQIGDGCLLCIDKCSNLKPAQLNYFIQFLSDFNKPIGLVFRINHSYARKLATSSKYKDCYPRLLKAVDNWRVLEQCTPDEIYGIAKASGINDEILLKDLVNSSHGSLTILKKNIERIAKLNPPT